MWRLAFFAAPAVVVVLWMVAPASADVHTLSVFKASEPPTKVAAGETFDVDGKVINYGAPPQRGRVSVNLLDKSSSSEEIPLVGSDVTERVNRGEIVLYGFTAEVPEGTGVGDYKVRVCVDKLQGSERQSCRKAGTTVVIPSGL